MTVQANDWSWGPVAISTAETAMNTQKKDLTRGDFSNHWVVHTRRTFCAETEDWCTSRNSRGRATFATESNAFLSLSHLTTNHPTVSSSVRASKMDSHPCQQEQHHHNATGGCTLHFSMVECVAATFFRAVVLTSSMQSCRERVSSGVTGARRPPSHSKYEAQHRTVGAFQKAVRPIENERRHTIHFTISQNAIAEQNAKQGDTCPRMQVNSGHCGVPEDPSGG